MSPSLGESAAPSLVLVLVLVLVLIELVLVLVLIELVPWRPPAPVHATRRRPPLKSCL